MFSIMLFLFLFFLGILALFFLFFRKMEQNARVLRDEHAQLRVLMRAMESHMDHMDRLETLRAREEGIKVDGDDCDSDEAGDIETSGKDPLLHLSFEAPAKEDDLPGSLNINFNPEEKTR